MGINFTNQIYNSVLVFSLFNFMYLYTVPLLSKLYYLKVVYPLLFIGTCDYFIVSNTSKQNNWYEIMNCYNSIIHACILMVFSIMYVYNIIGNGVYLNSLNYSIIYNGLDIFTLIKYNSRIKTQMIFHHTLLISVISIPYFIYVPTNYYYYVALNFLSEITTIPLNISWILYLQNKKNTTKFKCSILSTVILYLPFRVMNNTYILYDIHYNLIFNLKYLQIHITVLNYFWF